MRATPAKSSIQGRVSLRLCSFMISIRWQQWPKLLAPRSHPEEKLQVPDSDRSTLLNPQACFAEDVDHFGKAYVTMSVTIGNNASFSRGCAEIDRQHSASGP